MRSELRAELCNDEKLRLVVYDDATGKPLRKGMTLEGHPTIGYGRALDVNGISVRMANAMLDEDMADCEASGAEVPAMV
jgi:lysozyme